MTPEISSQKLPTVARRINGRNGSCREAGSGETLWAMRIARVSSRAGFLITALASAAAAAGLSAGPAAASPLPRPRPAPAARPAAPAAAQTPPAASAGHRHPIRVGTLTIPPCRASGLAWCTRVSVPLDYRHPALAHIKVGFQWYPATSGHAVGTILATEGGPGFPSTGTAADYLGAFQPLLGHRNLLLINLRGTGNSSAFTCRKLQNWKAAYGIKAYIADTGACGRQLNHTFKRPGRRVRARPATCTRRRTPPGTWPGCCAGCIPARSTSTVTPTAPSSARS